MSVLDIFQKLVDSNNELEFFELFFVEGNSRMKEKVKNLEDYINLNTKITVKLQRSDYKGLYDSRIEDVTKKYVLISHPAEDGVPIPMLPGTQLKIEFVNNDGRFNFESEVIGKHTEGSLSFIEIKIPKLISRNQLREFFRVSTNVNAKVKIFYPKVPDKNLKIPYKKVKCKVVDLSGGGGKLICEEHFEKGQVFGLDMANEIEGGEDIRCTAIRSKRISDKSEVSFKFNIMTDSERNPIIKYVFKRQIELKQILG